MTDKPFSPQPPAFCSFVFLLAGHGLQKRIFLAVEDSAKSWANLRSLVAALPDMIASTASFEALLGEFVQRAANAGFVRIPH